MTSLLNDLALIEYKFNKLEVLSLQLLRRFSQLMYADILRNFLKHRCALDYTLKCDRIYGNRVKAIKIKKTNASK